MSSRIEATYSRVSPYLFAWARGFPLNPNQPARRLFPCLLLAFAGILRANATTDADAESLYRQLLPLVRYENIQRTYSDVAAFGSRLSGSKGEAATFQYARRRLQALGIRDIQARPFTVTIPDPDSTGSLTLGGHTTKLYPLWPNLVRTSTCHAKGRIVYGGYGSLEELRGAAVQGNIVLLEFNSGSRWRNPAKLGAAAIVFIQPDAMPRAEAEEKFSEAPLDVPRFYLPLRDAGPVLTAAMRRDRAELSCRQDWVTRKSMNLVATLPGSDPNQTDQPIALQADADSMSVTPGICPGADEIGGLATLLEMARIYSRRAHARPLQLVVSGAHCLGLRGAREFVNDCIRNKIQPLLTVSLDLSSGSGGIGSFGRGWFYEYRDETQLPLQEISRLLRSHADRLASVEGIAPARLVLTDAVNNGDDRNWKNNIPGKFALDCEPLVSAGMNALTFRTVEDSRDQADTPFDTLDRVQLSNILRQVKTTVVMLHHLLDDTGDKNESSSYRMPLDPAPPSTMRLVGGFATVTGQVVEFDPQKSFIPDEKIPNSIAYVQGRAKTLMGVRGDLIQATEGPNALYRFDGLPPVTSYSTTDEIHLIHIGAMHLDRLTGRIDFAPTETLPGFDAYETDFVLKLPYRESPIVVFPCVTVSLFDMVDPQSLTALTFSRVVDPASGSFPRNYGVFSPGFDQRLSPDVEDAQVLFLLPGQRFQVMAGAFNDWGRLVLTNSNMGDEKGQGYSAPGGKPTGTRADAALSGRFADLPLATALDLANINDTRIARFEKYRIVSPGTKVLEQDARREIDSAQKAEATGQWADLDRHSRAAWGYALRAHPIVMATANDVVNGVVFYLFLLIPFSYFLERLVVGRQLLTKQLAWSGGFFVGSFFLLRLIHPAFEIVSNPSMIFIAFVMGALSLIVTTFILGKFENSMRAIRSEQTGIREVDIQRSGVAMAAFNLGVGNMRRRKARTILTTLTLVVMTFIVLSFTSIVNELHMDETPSKSPATYPGILLRSPGLDPMQVATYRQIANEFGDKAKVVRRAYYYGADIGTTGILTLQRGDSVAEARAMLGMDAAEDEVTDPGKAIYAGRWFKPGERNVMVLPRPLAEQLKLDSSEVGKATVQYAGTAYKVVGLADTAILRSLTDLDGDGVLPADFTLSKEFQTQKATSNQAFRSYIRLDPSSIFIVPAETAMQLGADLRTVAVRFNDPSETRKALNALMPRIRFNLYAAVPVAPASHELEVRQFSVQEGSKSTGILLIAIQLIIASVFVLNTMIASVYERTREIGIFSSIGLAPNHIAMLFFAESLVYGILGAVIGYFAAQFTAKIIVATGSLQGLILNFSSTSAVLSAVIVMAVVVGSTIYPARLAAKIAAPAMNDEVFQTDPEGDVWDLPLPFSIGATEAEPLAVFLTQWLKAYEGYTIGDIVTAGASLASSLDSPPRYHIESTMWLVPYDLGIQQKLELDLTPSLIEGVYTLDLRLTRLAGDPENWPTVNRRFLASIRKQFLTWRTLRQSEQANAAA